MRNKETGARPKASAMQSRLSGTSVKLPPPMKNVRVIKYYNSKVHSAPKTKPINNKTKSNQFKPIAQSSPPPFSYP